jgi:hypothetical protein
MSFNFGETRDVIIHFSKTQYKKINQVKTNFRVDISEKSLNEGMMINFPYTNVYHSYKCNTVNIPLSRKFKRASVIPYTFINNKKYYCMGIDSNHGTITDFGGGIKKIETFAGAASRELYEESLGIFNFNPINLYKYSVAAYDSNMIILAVYVKIKSKESIVKNFFTNFHKANNPEVSSIIWIPSETFYELVKSGKSIKTDEYVYPPIYKPISDLLRSVSSNNEII